MEASGFVRHSHSVEVVVVGRSSERVRSPASSHSDRRVAEEKCKFNGLKQ